MDNNYFLMDKGLIEMRLKKHEVMSVKDGSTVNKKYASLDAYPMVSKRKIKVGQYCMEAGVGTLRNFAEELECNTQLIRSYFFKRPAILDLLICGVMALKNSSYDDPNEIRGNQLISARNYLPSDGQVLWLDLSDTKSRNPKCAIGRGYNSDSFKRSDWTHYLKSFDLPFILAEAVRMEVGTT